MAASDCDAQQTDPRLSRHRPRHGLEHRAGRRSSTAPCANRFARHTVARRPRATVACDGHRHREAACGRECGARAAEFVTSLRPARSTSRSHVDTREAPSYFAFIAAARPASSNRRARGSPAIHFQAVCRAAVRSRGLTPREILRGAAHAYAPQALFARSLAHRHVASKPARCLTRSGRSTLRGQRPPRVAMPSRPFGGSDVHPQLGLRRSMPNRRRRKRRRRAAGVCHGNARRRLRRLRA